MKVKDIINEFIKKTDTDPNEVTSQYEVIQQLSELLLELSTKARLEVPPCIGQIYDNVMLSLLSWMDDYDLTINLGKSEYEHSQWNNIYNYDSLMELTVNVLSMVAGNTVEDELKIYEKFISMGYAYANTVEF